MDEYLTFEQFKAEFFPLLVDGWFPLDFGSSIDENQICITVVQLDNIKDAFLIKPHYRRFLSVEVNTKEEVEELTSYFREGRSSAMKYLDECLDRFTTDMKEFGPA